MTIDELMSDAERPANRLRWLVLSRFCILPFSAEAEMISDEEILKMAAQMQLDRNKGAEQHKNPSFSEERFAEVKGFER